MPIATFHVVGCTPAQRSRLLEEGSAIYAAALESPVERVRCYVVPHLPEEVAVGGEVGASSAPYFTAVVLAGRSAGQRARLLGDLTALTAEVLDVPVGSVRGHIVQVDPEDWGIGGVPAAEVRVAEIKARAEEQQP